MPPQGEVASLHESSKAPIGTVWLQHEPVSPSPVDGFVVAVISALCRPSAETERVIFSLSAKTSENVCAGPVEGVTGPAHVVA